MMERIKFQLYEEGKFQMLRMSSTAIALFLTLPFISIAQADLSLGVISNFQDGTVQGWGGGTVGNVSNVGPLGNGDHSLQLSNGGTGGFFAMFNTGVNGVISPSVNSITTDIFRPLGVGPAEIRLVLFDSIDASRWTSTVAMNVVDDGAWHNYSFSIREADLTRVIGDGTYASLTGNLQRIMFRYDDGVPSSGGAALNSFMYYDNITAVPEPSMMLMANILIAGCVLRRRR